MSSDQNKKRKKSISHSLSVKKKAIQELNDGVPVSVIATNLDVTNATVMLWKKNENKLNEWFRKSTESVKHNKRMRTSDYDIIDRIMWMWYREKRASGIPLPGPLIQTQAKFFHKTLELQDKFEASNGWLYRWQKRHGIRSVTICGEKLPANNDAAESFKTEFNEYIEAEGLVSDQIFNCDEAGLNFKMLPNTTLSTKDEGGPSGFKGNKERITVMACSNASGSLKLPLVVIGKSARPRAIKDLRNLPVYYRSQKSAWMNTQIFTEWFENEFVPKVTEFLRLKRLPLKAVLYLENCSAHPETLSKENITTRFLPPNTTLPIQPMDQNCLQTLKSYYRQYLMTYLLEHINSEDTLTSGLKKMTIRDVIFWIAGAWQRVSVETIRKSWDKLWPNINDTVASNDNCAITETAMDHGNTAETREITGTPQNDQLLTQSKNFVEALQVLDQFKDIERSHVDTWLNSTTNMLPEECYNDDEIVQIFRDELNLNKENIDSNNNSKHKTKKKISVIEAYKAIKIAIEYCKDNENYSNEINLALLRAQDIVTNEFLLHSNNQ